MKAVFRLALLAAVALGACDSADKHVVQLVNEAVALLNDGNSLQAAGKLRAVVQLRPEDADANYYLGYLALRDGDPKTAVGHLEIAVQFDPARPEGHLDLARARLELGDEKGAIAALGPLLAADPGHPQAHFLAARVAYKHGAREEANRALRAAIGGDPGFHPAYLLLARLYTDVGAYKAALEVLNEGLKFAPDEIGLQEALGLGWLDVGRPDRAREVFAIAVQNPRADWTTYVNHAAALLQVGEKEAAAKELERGLLVGRGRGDAKALEGAARMLRRLRQSKG
jgi:tetratricopeptide (TPR) repeat protein